MSLARRAAAIIAKSVLPALALAGAMSLCGCGFTPLYGKPGVTGGLSSISVNVNHGRTAFLLGQDLEDSLARDRSSAPAYRLDVRVLEHSYPRGLQVNGVATRYEVHVTVTYRLIELSSGQVLKTGVEPVEVSYAETSQPYAGVAAQQDAEVRAASEAADRLRATLAVFFANRAPPAA
jgi:LPS-assembly lipoprotein